MSEGESSKPDAARSPELPPTPDGYAEPYAFEYPTVALLVGSGLLGAVSSVAVVTLLSLVQGPAVFASVYQVTVDGDVTTYAVDLTVVGVPFLVALLVTVVVHEWLHGLAFGYYGHDVSYGAVPTMGAFYAAAFGQFQRREDLLRVAFAPLLAITAVCLPLLVVPIPVVAITAAFVLILNTAGAVGDLYAAWRFRRTPPGTLAYDVDLRHSYIYEPLEG